MAVSYIVQQGPSATGPWIAVTGSPFSSASCTISGETPNTSYYVQITAQDIVLGISSTPAVFGPYTTLSTSSESPAGTTVTTVGPSINASPTPGTAGSGNILTITAGGQIALNGTTLGGANVTELYYTGASTGANGATSHTAYQENAAGNWFGPIVASGTGTQLAGSPIPAGPGIAISTIGTQTTNTPFTVSGTLTGYSSAPTLQYDDNSGAFGALPVSNTVTATTFSFTHPSIAAANASATVGIRDANATTVSATSNAFVVQAVVAGAPGTPTALTSPGQTVSTITVSWAAPTTGGALNNGLYQVLYKTIAAGSYANGPTVSYVTPGSGSFSALGGTWSVSSGGVVAFTGTGGPGTSSGVTMMVLVAGTVWQFNGTNWYGTTTPGSWPLGGNTTSPLSVTITSLANPQSYNIEVEVSNTSGQGIPCAPITAATQTSTGQFSISQGKILGPSGSIDIRRGVCNYIINPVSANPQTQDFATISSVFPGISVFKACLSQNHTPADVQGIVNDWTGHGCVVILANYLHGAQYTIDPSWVAPDAAMFGAFGAAFKSNPYVWFSTMNEARSGGAGANLDDDHSATYNAIRGAGNNSIIMFGMWGGSPLWGDNFGNENPAVYRSMTNVVWEDHPYGAQATTGFANLQSRVAAYNNWTTSADGQIPVFWGEWGDAADGSGGPHDQPDAQIVKDIVNSCVGNGNPGVVGQTAWVYDNFGQTGGDCLQVGNAIFQQADNYGQVVANSIRNPNTAQ